MHIAIIGNGIAGITAARHLRKLSTHEITVISAETDFFFSRTALMYIYMGHMKYEHTKPYEDSFWEKNNIQLKRAFVESIDFRNKLLEFRRGGSMPYDKLILACGSKPNKFGWPGQDLKGVQGLYSYQDLESMEKFSDTTQRAVIVGGGLIGIEMAEMFHSRHIPVTFLVRENRFWGNVLPERESEMVKREILRNDIDLRLGEELQEIISDPNGRAKAVKTKKGETIECQFVGLTAGVSPNINFLKDTAIEVERGILVDSHMQTNLPDVYAIGDCAQHRNPPTGRRAVEQVWYTGRMMGEVAAQAIAGIATPYAPGPWFNSAKFFDLEYQTYGMVPAKAEEGIESLYWEHQDRRKCMHITYRTSDLVVQGINVFGIRHRHEVWDRWLKEERKLPYVAGRLAEANFDPEFFKTYEQEIAVLYNQKFPENPIQSQRKRRLLDWIGL